MITYLHMHPHMWVAVVLLIVLLGVLFYLLVWRREPEYLPGPAEPDYRGDQLGSPAGEPEWEDESPEEIQRAWDSGTPVLVVPVAWEDLDPDTQADQLISEWHAGEGCMRCENLDGTISASCYCREEHERTALVEDHVTAWLDDPDLIVWDAKQQAARCWEILHIEFPRLRAELGIAA